MSMVMKFYLCKLLCVIRDVILIENFDKETN